MRNNTQDAVIYRYDEFLKELYIDTQYIEPIVMRDLIQKHSIGKCVPNVAEQLGIIKRIEINGKKLRGRYEWLTHEPSIDLAIQLKEACTSYRLEQKKKDVIVSGYWQTTTYLFGLIKIRKWISI